MLDEIKARHKEASAGDWQWIRNRSTLWASLTEKTGILVLSCPNDDFGDLRPTEGDAEFIAHAPKDIEYFLNIFKVLGIHEENCPRCGQKRLVSDIGEQGFSICANCDKAPV